MTGFATTRAQVLAYRVAAQQLHRVDQPPARLAVLDLGVQDTPHGSARLALAARSTAALDDEALTLVWSVRGAPHLHRTADLPRLAAALWPLDDADAGRRVASSLVKGAAGLGLAGFVATADAFHRVVTGPMAKGEVSTSVSALVPPAATFFCQACAATHISGSLFQQAGLAGGVRVRVVGGKTVLEPIDGWAGRPVRAAGTEAVVSAYLRLLGPATPAEVAAFLGTGPAEVRRVWPAGLVEVDVDGRAAWLPEAELPRLRAARPEPLVRLLPPADPFLQARDRELLLPAKARRSQVWRAISAPGVLLVDGELVGIWRAKLAGRSRLDVTVQPFDPLGGTARAVLDEEAARLATVRGARDVRVAVAG